MAKKPAHCATCRCLHGAWRVEVCRPGARAAKTCQTRDDAILFAQRSMEGFVPVDWFHEATITITFGGPDHA